MDSTPVNVGGLCLEHPDRQGMPCRRCGTFRCPECLSDELCAPCRKGLGIEPPQPEDTVGFGRRAGARLIDLIFHQFAGGLGGAIAGIALAILQAAGLIEPGWMQRLDHGRLLDVLFGSIASVSGAAIGASIAGASLGKVILGMRVVRRNGQRAGLKYQFIRELAYFVDALFFGLMAKAAMDDSQLQQRFGDQWAETVVVRANSPSGAVASTTARLFVGIASGFAVHAAVLATFTVLLSR